MNPIATFQSLEIESAKASGAEMFLGVPDGWYEPAPEYGCSNGHVSRRYLKSEAHGPLCLVCGERIVMIPHGYSDESLHAALTRLK